MKRGVLLLALVAAVATAVVAAALTGAVICCSAMDGAEPMAPVANCTFWPRTVCKTSAALMRKLRSLSGFSQMRIE